MRNKIGKLAVRCHMAAENWVTRTKEGTLARFIAKRNLRIVYYLCWQLAGDAMQREIEIGLMLALARCKEYWDEEATIGETG